MKGLTPEAMAAACDGRLLHCDEILAREVVAVTTDSRTVTEGSLYIPMKGEHADGHDFLAQAYARGALLCLTARAAAVGEQPAILVGDTALAIQKIAGLYRQNLGIPVVGITGSVGKTGTKEMVANVLRQKFRVLATEGNFNNNLGLPLTIFRITEEDELAVLEMGINHFGEMALLGETARPDVMVYTNIGDCHLEFLGDRAGVYKAKTECLPYLSGARVVIANGEDAELARLADEKGIKLKYFGRKSGDGSSQRNRPHIVADDIESLGTEGTRFSLHTKGQSLCVHLPLPGEHRVLNALAAAAVGEQFGLSLEEIKAGLESAETLAGRFAVTEVDGRTIIDDSYNANPMSMRAALQTLAEMPAPRVAILGDMGELGPEEAKMHEELGRFAATLPVDTFLLAGELSESIRGGILSENPQADVRHFKDTDALLVALPDNIPEHATILVKASHFMDFEIIVNDLKQ